MSKSLKKLRVLIVEDHFLVGETIQSMVEDLGYTVVGRAKDGQQAIDKVKSLRPSVVLMDIELPDKDGIEVTQYIQTNCPTPVVILSAYDTPELVKRASAAGAGAYLVKPPQAREMERSITIAMARFADMMELRRLNVELQTRNEDLDAFAHTVAYGLKDPLGWVIGFVMALEKDYVELSDEELKQSILKITQHGRKMSNIINELMMLTSVRQLTGVQIKPLDMASIVAEACERLSFSIEEHQAEIIHPPAWPVALGYSPWVEEVWVNYLGNALVHGGRPPRVELGATVQEDNVVRFWVKDNGPGIPPEAQAQLFIPLTQLNHKPANELASLGLAIVRRIVQRLNGQVGVESQVGQGSVFSFTLPASR